MRNLKQNVTNVTYLTVLYCTVLYCTTMFSSCSKDNKETDTVETEVVNKVWEYSKTNPDGFTLDIQTFKPVTKGFAVSYKETQNSFEKEGLKKAISHALKHNNIVGGWLNSENGYYYFDSVKVFEDSKLEEAIKFAKENEQMAIYDLTNQKEILVSEYKLLAVKTFQSIGIYLDSKISPSSFKSFANCLLIN